MRRKPALLALLSLVLVGVVTVGATLAYLTDVTKVETTYVLGNIKIEVKEPEWDKGNAGRSNGSKFEGDAGFLMPGRIFTKDPTVVVKANSADCYIRLRVTIDNDLWNVIDVPQAKTGWVVTGPEAIPGAKVYYYTYGSKITSSTSEASFLAFDTVEVLPVAKVSGDHAILLARATSSQATGITVQGQAMQADGFTSVDEAFKMFDMAPEAVKQKA